MYIKYDDMKKLVVFDLDGTLLDTIDDLAHSCDEIMKRHAHPRHSNDEYRSYVGNGVRKLLERSLPKEYKNDSPYIDALLAEFLEYYHNHIADHTTIYDGIVKALETISSMGINIAVLSNKYHYLHRAHCAQHHALPHRLRVQFSMLCTLQC